MGIVEIVAVTLFLISGVGAFLQFFPHWKPARPEWLGKVWDTVTHTWLSIGLFVFGMALLYAFG
jgi:hypothetical protein